jgi:hypothetical protein
MTDQAAAPTHAHAAPRSRAEPPAGAYRRLEQAHQPGPRGRPEGDAAGAALGDVC